MKSIEIPNGVTEIGSFEFSGCDNLTEITFPASLKVLNKIAFGYIVARGKTFYIPKGATIEGLEDYIIHGNTIIYY